MIQERKITLEAASVDDALNEISEQWQIPVTELEANILSEEKGGFLGLFGKNKKLLVEVKALNNTDNNSQPGLISRSPEFVNDILKLMDFEAKAVVSESEKNTLEIIGDDSSDYVVGRYGDALKALEYIVNLALRDPKNEPRLKIDSCGYRERRTKSLERLAEATARQAVKYGRPVRLEPMASWERWVIHTTLKENPDVTTESVGEQPMRKVVVIPKYDPDNIRNTGPAMMRVRALRERNSKRNNNNNSGRPNRKFRR